MNARVLFLALALLFSATFAVAQTRRIKHRSHHGTQETFALLMDEDHLGIVDPSSYINAPVLKFETYDVKAWVDSLKRKYPSAEAEAVVGSPVQGTEPKETEEAMRENQPRGSTTTAPKINGIGKEVAQQTVPITVNETAWQPPQSQSDAISFASGNALGLLFALLLFPVAPAVFLLSAMRSSQRKGE